MTSYYMPAPVDPAKLRRWIAARGFQQQQFAVAMRVSKNTVGNWVSGRVTIRQARRELIEGLAATLAVRPEDLAREEAE